MVWCVFVLGELFGVKGLFSKLSRGLIGWGKEKEVEMFGGMLGGLLESIV